MSNCGSERNCSARSWRDYVHGLRIMLGTFFIGQPGATTADVGRLLGFGAPSRASFDSRPDHESRASRSTERRLVAARRPAR